MINHPSRSDHHPLLALKFGSNPNHLRSPKGPLSWLFPLLVIIACLLLVALIIYGCSAWKKHKYRQYNVAQKERHLKDNNTDPEQQKQLPAQQEGEADD